MFETLLTKSAQCWYDNLEADVKKQWDSVQKKFEDTYFNTNSNSDLIVKEWKAENYDMERAVIHTSTVCLNYLN